jgi:hypothetical protein
MTVQTNRNDEAVQTSPNVTLHYGSSLSGAQFSTPRRESACVISRPKACFYRMIRPSIAMVVSLGEDGLGQEFLLGSSLGLEDRMVRFMPSHSFTTRRVLYATLSL